LPDFAVQSGFEILTPTEFEVSSFYNLPKIRHKDPFDRMLIWQAIKNNISVITADRILSEYKEFGLRTEW